MKTLAIAHLLYAKMRASTGESRIAQPSVYAVTVRATGKLVCPRVLAATGFAARTRGLLGRSSLVDEGLWLDPSQGVHTFGMRFPIDVVALDRDRRVVAIAARVPPWRIAGVGLRTRSVLELPPGSAALVGVLRGDLLEFRY